MWHRGDRLWGRLTHAKPPSDEYMTGVIEGASDVWDKAEAEV